LQGWLPADELKLQPLERLDLQDILVFVPGLLGSELYDSQGKVWPGSLIGGVFGFDDDHFRRLLAPNLTVGGLVETVGGLVDIYRRWLRAFRALTRHNKQLFSDSCNPPSLYTVPFDWRLALEDSAADQLAPVIRKARSDWGENVHIHLVAHSLGGLLSRYYLQSGRFTADPGFSSIKTFITFGTPHNGAPVALAGAVGLHKTSFMSIEQSKQLANDARYPALYQTFPLFNAPLIWKSMPRGRLEPITLADTQFVIETLHLNQKNLDRALAFRRSLEAAPIPTEIRCFLLIGSRFETITHFFWTGSEIQKEETPDGGDGTVSIEGAYLGGSQVQFTGESHIELIDSNVARATFQQLFDANGLAAPEVGRLTLSLRDLTVDLSSEVHVRIKAEGGFAHLSGQLVWERAVIPRDKKRSTAEPKFRRLASLPRVPIDYSGPIADAVALRLQAPSRAGVYRLRLVKDARSETVSAAFVVGRP
jgi:lecithin:cholesterol acyltransferase